MKEGSNSANGWYQSSVRINGLGPALLGFLLGHLFCNLFPLLTLSRERDLRIAIAPSLTALLLFCNEVPINLLISNLSWFLLVTTLLELVLLSFRVSCTC